MVFLLVLSIILFFHGCVNLLNILMVVLLLLCRSVCGKWMLSKRLCIIFGKVFLVFLVLAVVEITQPHYLLDVMGLSDTTIFKVKESVLMSIVLCDYYYTFCPEDCPDDETCRCPFFAAEYEDYHQYTIWELI